MPAVIARDSRPLRTIRVGGPRARLPCQKALTTGVGGVGRADATFAPAEEGRSHGGAGRLHIGLENGQR